MSIVKLLLDIGETLNDCETVNGNSSFADDQERYLKMAMKIDSEDPYILERNENHIIYRMILLSWKAK